MACCCYSSLEASSSERKSAENNNELFDAIDELQNMSDDGSQNDDLIVNVSDYSSKEILSTFDLANQDIIMNDTSLNDFDIDTFVSEVIENNANQNVIENQFPQQQVDFLRDTPPPSPEEIFRINILPENVPQIQNPPIRRNQASEDKRKIGEIGRKINNIKDKRVTICPIPECKRRFEKNNKSRDLSDHLLKKHFKEELARDGVKDEKPHRCPLRGARSCDANKIFKNYQDLKRHFGGNGSVHGKMLTYLDEKLASEHRKKAEIRNNKIVISDILV